MIQIIGLIVAAYCIPRLLSMIARDSEKPWVKIVAGLGTLAIIGLVVLLINAGEPASRLQQ